MSLPGVQTPGQVMVGHPSRNRPHKAVVDWGASFANAAPATSPPNTATCTHNEQILRNAGTRILLCE